MDKKDITDYTKLLYSLEQFKDQFKKIGDLAKKNKIRLTFHPDLFNVLNSPDVNIVLRTYRDLHMHVTILNLMELDMNSIVILHGGGVYGDKENAMKRWIDNFNNLPLYIKQRVVLENDENCFSINNVLYMASKVEPFTLETFDDKTFDDKTFNNKIDNKIDKRKSVLIKVPIVFDIFHYTCYNEMIKIKKLPETQLKMRELLPIVQLTWVFRDMNVVSGTIKGASIGTHSDYVETIPVEIIEFVKENKNKKENKKENKKDIYLMVEAKAKELALIYLRKKYNSICL